MLTKINLELVKSLIINNNIRGTVISLNSTSLIFYLTPLILNIVTILHNSCLDVFPQLRLLVTFQIVKFVLDNHILNCFLMCFIAEIIWRCSWSDGRFGYVGWNRRGSCLLQVYSPAGTAQRLLENLA